MLSPSRTRPDNVRVNPIHPWLSSAIVAFSGHWLQLMPDPSPRVRYPVQAPQQLSQVASPISVPRSIVRIYAASTIKGAKFSSEAVPMYAVARLAGSAPVPTSNDPREHSAVTFLYRSSPLHLLDSAAIPQLALP